MYYIVLFDKQGDVINLELDIFVRKFMSEING